MASDARLSNQLDLFGYELKAVREAFVPAEVAEVVPMPRTLPPRPQGPIVIMSGGSAQVNFKNVFQQPTEFSFVSDSAAFTVAKPKEMVPPKKSISLALSFKPPVDAAGTKQAASPRTVGWSKISVLGSVVQRVSAAAA